MSGMRLINHIRLWNRWRKHCTNSALYKVLVLMGLIHSPTFERLRGEQFGEWVNTKDRLPENAKHKGANCETVLVKTKWGITEGWYNPDVPCWFIIAIFMYYNDSEVPNLIDFERGDIPKLVHVPDTDVTHWMPLPEPPKEGENK